MKKKKELLGIISINKIIAKKRNMFHKPTRAESNKKNIKREKEKIRKEISNYY